MKCTRCRAKAEVHLRQHRTAFCRTCFVPFFQRQVERAIHREKMFTADESVPGSSNPFVRALLDALVDRSALLERPAGP